MLVSLIEGVKFPLNSGFAYVLCHSNETTATFFLCTQVIRSSNYLRLSPGYLWVLCLHQPCPTSWFHHKPFTADTLPGLHYAEMGEPILTVLLYEWMELINIIALLRIASVPLRLAAAEQTSGGFLWPCGAQFEVCTFNVARSALACWEENLMEGHGTHFPTMVTSLGGRTDFPMAWFAPPSTALLLCDAAELGVMPAAGGPRLLLRW